MFRKTLYLRDCIDYASMSLSSIAACAVFVLNSLAATLHSKVSKDAPKGFHADRFPLHVGLIQASCSSCVVISLSLSNASLAASSARAMMSFTKLESGSLRYGSTLPI